MESSVRWIIVGFLLLLAGVVLPFVMVLRLVQPTLLLNFISYACSTAGLIVGFVGIARYRADRR